MNSIEEFERSRDIERLKSKSPCPTLFCIAMSHRKTLKQLRDEIQALLEMPEEELDDISEKMQKYVW